MFNATNHINVNPNVPQPETSCSVCLRSFPLNSLDECQCGEHTCGEFDCHAYACACQDDNPDAQRLRTALRTNIRERFKQLSAKELLGDSFPINHEGKLILLTNLVASLRAELEIIHMLEDGDGGLMEDRQPISLAGQKARIKVGEVDFIVTFGSDVRLSWESGKIVNSTEPAILHPEIQGHLEPKDDYSYIKDAELILDDRRVFKISFHDPTHFFAHESINSRNRVY